MRTLSEERRSDSPKTKKKKKYNKNKREKRRKKPDKNKLEKLRSNQKKLKIIYMTPMTSDLNPIHSVRFMDYVFPLDTSFLLSDNKHRKEHFVFGDPRTFKRIKKMTVDKNTKEETRVIEEKFIDTACPNKGIETFPYFIMW